MVLIEDPVSSKYGHTYEKAEIERWVNDHHRCPMTNQPLELTDLFPNFTVKAAIAEYKKIHSAQNVAVSEVKQVAEPMKKEAGPKG